MIENHVTSLEASKELAKILPEGYESAFVYIEDDLYVVADDGLPMSLVTGHRIASTTKERVSALLLTEVLELLPEHINVADEDETWEEICLLHIEKTSCAYEGKTLKPYIQSLFGIDNETHNMATAAARLAIWLVENGYELNKI
jgi:hypothetical protein